jgi:hypothetical protein
MKTDLRRLATGLTLALGWASSAWAGGAWVPDPGHGYVYLGFSRKTAGSSWSVQGNAYDNVQSSTGKVSWHDFRYLYLTAEVGVFKNFSLVLTPTWLYGLEGPKDNYEKNVGLSDAWIGFKYQVRKGSFPMAFGFNHRSPYFYDLPGAYSRTLFDSSGRARGVSPEWRGLLKHDYSLSYLASRSLFNYRGWASLEAGYTWRDGAPANQVYLSGDGGYPLPFAGAQLKAAAHFEHSVGSDSPRQPDDRFGASATNNFNRASYLKLGASAILPFGSHKEWAAEVGYNRWVWGRSARRYKEPFISVGRSF